MIYDAIAAGNPSTYRLAKTREFLKSEKDEQVRKDWLNSEQKLEYGLWKMLAIPSLKDLPHIPNSWAIQFTFALATPYMSKGIEAFDLLDNPIIRDKVFEVPIVPASSWKGGLRSAAVLYVMEEKTWGLQDAAKDDRIIRLFGNEHDASDGFHAGRLHCFPTGFQKTTCEVINPHDRARRVGTNPILLECVPAGEEGTFTVLYVPFSKVENGEAAEDLELCAKAIQALLTVWGIGAKKSNGNGLAHPDPIRGQIVTITNQPQPTPPQYPNIVQPYLEMNGEEAFKLSKKEWREAHRVTGAEAEQYATARNAYRAYQEAQANFSNASQEWQKTKGRTLKSDSIASLADLDNMARSGTVATTLKENKEN